MQTTHFLISQGTYWYHSHFQAQYCDGVRGALVIYDPDGPETALYDVDSGNIDVVFQTSFIDPFLQMTLLLHWQTGTITVRTRHRRLRGYSSLFWNP